MRILRQELGIFIFLVAQKAQIIQTNSVISLFLFFAKKFGSTLIFLPNLLVEIIIIRKQKCRKSNTPSINSICLLQHRPSELVDSLR